MSGYKRALKRRNKKRKPDPPPAGFVRGSCSIDVPAQLATAIKETGIKAGGLDEGIPLGAAVSSFMLMVVTEELERIMEA